MTGVVIGFLGAMRRAFARELRAINAEYRARRSRIGRLPIDRHWFEDDPSAALTAEQVELAVSITKARLHACVHAAKKYGQDPKPFERRLEAWSEVA